MNGDDFAFPVPERIQHGLTKRELFAAMAMQGIIAADNSSHLGSEKAAAWAVDAADALLAALRFTDERTP